VTCSWTLRLASNGETGDRTDDRPSYPTELQPLMCLCLLPSGLSTCHYAWAFHSEAEEELLNMLPSLHKGEPTWPELRSMGVGWWLRSSNKLRRCIEKVRHPVTLIGFHSRFWCLCSDLKRRAVADLPLPEIKLVDSRCNLFFFFSSASSGCQDGFTEKQ